MILKVLKECFSDALRMEFLKHVLDISTSVAPPLPSVQVLQSNSFGRLQWSEYTVRIVDSILTLKLPLEPNTTQEIVRCLREQMASPIEPDKYASGIPKTLAASLKFSGLVFSFLSKYKTEARPHKQVLVAVADGLETFMKKSAAAAAARL